LLLAKHADLQEASERLKQDKARLEAVVEAPEETIQLIQLPINIRYSVHASISGHTQAEPADASTGLLAQVCTISP
jgi:hypothetical protein